MIQITIGKETIILNADNMKKHAIISQFTKKMSRRKEILGMGIKHPQVNMEVEVSQIYNNQKVTISGIFVLDDLVLEVSNNDRKRS